MSENTINSIYVKLWEMQCSIERFLKDGENKSMGAGYKYVSSDEVLNKVRPLLNKHGLIVKPQIDKYFLHETSTEKGTMKYMTELELSFTWIDVQTGHTFTDKFYAQGTDIAGEKGVGKALTYGEKYYFMKLFHVPTSKDDPDNDRYTSKGDKAIKGTQAEKETRLEMRHNITAMLNELCAGDPEKIQQSMIVFTKSSDGKYLGVDSLDLVSDKALPVVYNKVKNSYRAKTGKTYAPKSATLEVEGITIAMDREG